MQTPVIVRFSTVVHERGSPGERTGAFFSRGLPPPYYLSRIILISTLDLPWIYPGIIGTTLDLAYICFGSTLVLPLL